MNLSEHLLANREAISLQAARVYLGSRVRVRTPLGASEFLMVRCPPPRGWGDPKEDQGEMKKAFEARVKIALDCDEIYRAAFPEEYRKSPSPYLSLQREQELYQLIHARLFPLLWSFDDNPVATAPGSDPLPQVASRWHVQRVMETEPDFWLPYIPLRGAQRHMWNAEYTSFEEVGLAYQVAWALSREFYYADDPAAWQQLNNLHGLDFREPALPLASVGWTELLHTCAVETTPLRYLPLVFQAISYKTGNRFLDLPQIGAMGFNWGLREIIDMHLSWGNALDIMHAIDVLGSWLEEDPKVRVGRAYDIWNRAAAIEAEHPFAGMLAGDLIEAGGIPMGGENVLLTRALVDGVERMIGEARA